MRRVNAGPNARRGRESGDAAFPRRERHQPPDLRSTTLSLEKDAPNFRGAQPIGMDIRKLNSGEAVRVPEFPAGALFSYRFARPTADLSTLAAEMGMLLGALSVGTWR